MADPIRVPPQEAKEKARSGAALLVCGYEDEEKFNMVRLEGAVSLTEFQSKLPSLEKDHEIIFYCAWPQDGTAAGQAVKYTEKGYTNVKVLGGGVDGWKQAGYALM